jgi:hypothetical protein
MKASVFSLTISLVSITCCQSTSAGELHFPSTNSAPDSNDIPLRQKLEELIPQAETVNTNQGETITNIDEAKSEGTNSGEGNETSQASSNQTNAKNVDEARDSSMKPQDGGANPPHSPQSNEEKKEQEGEDTTGSQPQSEDKAPEESGDYEDVLIFVCVVLLLLFFRKKWIQGHLHRGWSRISGASSVVSEDFTYGVSSLDDGLSSGNGRRGGVHNRRNLEMAPLTSTTEDEWGWEASGGNVTDVERGLSLSQGVMQEEENLQVAMAMSLSTSNASHESGGSSSGGGGGDSGGSSASIRGKSSGGSVTSYSRKGSTVYNIKPTPSSLPVSRQDSWDNEDSWDNAPVSTASTNTIPHKTATNRSNSITKLTSSTTETPTTSDSATIEELLAEQTKNMNLPVVTSLSKKTAARSSSGDLSQKKSLVKKHTAEEEDIFSSMGLSAAPKLTSSTSNSAPKPRVSSGGFNSSSTATTNITRNSNVRSTSPMEAYTNSNFATKSDWNASSLLEEDSMNGGSEWGDDSDLDDLLDD